MRAVTKTLADEAQSIFADLGYTVTRDGTELRAERKWRVVHVTPVDTLDDPPTDGDYRCFVTWGDDAGSLERTLDRVNPDYEWAIIAVTPDGDYEITGPPSAA